KEAAALVATVVGQDLEQTADGRFRIARRVAPDRVISTVDPEARHGHKTQARGFDGYKGHIAIDPDSEIITSAAVTAANLGDGSVAKDLLQDVIPAAAEVEAAAAPGAQASTAAPPAAAPQTASPEGVAAASEPVEVFGDASYGSAEVLT